MTCTRANTRSGSGLPPVERYFGGYPDRTSETIHHRPVARLARSGLTRTPLPAVAAGEASMHTRFQNFIFPERFSRYRRRFRHRSAVAWIERGVPRRKGEGRSRSEEITASRTSECSVEPSFSLTALARYPGTLWSATRPPPAALRYWHPCVGDGAGGRGKPHHARPLGAPLSPNRTAAVSSRLQTHPAGASARDRVVRSCGTAHDHASRSGC